jgi:hypothetical protein
MSWATFWAILSQTGLVNLLKNDEIKIAVTDSVAVIVHS